SPRISFSCNCKKNAQILVSLAKRFLSSYPMQLVCLYILPHFISIKKYYFHNKVIKKIKNKVYSL
ncbi:MAG: hypothetical protein ACRC1D_02605, partial [Culicoidibacterales bacterium]